MSRGASPLRDLLALAGFLALCFGVAALGGLATARSVGTWYQTLERPFFAPPDWLFGPVWTVLYAMMAVAAWRVWRLPATTERRWALVLWSAQLALNLAWSFLFFGLQAPGLALVDIVLLLGLIAATTMAFLRLDRPAGLLMLPYLAWVAYASILNAAIWLLN
jgi:translocator protein